MSKLAKRFLLMHAGSRCYEARADGCAQAQFHCDGLGLAYIVQLVWPDFKPGNPTSDCPVLAYSNANPKQRAGISPPANVDWLRKCERDCSWV
jgi:hypothetical protein